jgi:hypothetical protein
MNINTDLNSLKDEILSLMKDSVKDLWKKEDTEFLKKLAEDVAAEAWAVKTAPADVVGVHKRNLEHLASTVKGEVVRREIKLRMWQKDLFVKILETIIKTVASVVLDLAKAKMG